MAIAPPPIQTYHCLCTTLLLTTTHTLSSLPRRTTSSSSSSSADLILPLPSTPPSLESPELPEAGYTTLHSLTPDKKPTIIRREDGFEKRVLYRCGRCRLVVGYEIEGEGKGKERDGEGKVLYLLPRGVVSTDVMMGKGRRVGEGDIGLGKEEGGGGVGVFE